MESKFKVGDKVYIKPWHIIATIYYVDDEDSTIPYLAEDEYG